MKRLLPVTFMVLMVVSILGWSKSNPIRPLLRSAFEKYDQGQFIEAVDLYQKVLSIDSTYSEAHYYLADCFRYLFKYEEALNHYQQVQAIETPKYPLLEFYLGVTHKSLSNYQEAEKYFRAFIKADKGIEQSAYWLLKANIELQGIVKARNVPRTTTRDIQITRLPSPVNTTKHDFAAIPYQNPHQLVVTSTRSESKGLISHQQHGGAFSDNFIFLLDSNQWRNRTSLHNFETLNTTTDEGPGSISSDGNTYYFCRFNKGYYQLYVSERSNGKWNTPQLVPEPVNLPQYTVKHPAISASGDTLFFSSDRPGGYGEYDLWMSVRQQNEWQAPINLGSLVNTPFQETSPYWNSEQQVLFFASNGHPGWGGYDLFLVSRARSVVSSSVINLGKPLNSSYDDTYFWTNDRAGYLTSNRGGSSTGFDIYEYRLSADKKNVLLAFSSQSQWADWANRLIQLSASSGEDQPQFFQLLSSEEQKSLRQAATQRIFRTLQEEGAPTLAEIDETQQLATLYGENLQWLVKSQRMFLQNFQVITWPDEVYQWYSTLPSEEKEKVKRAARVLLRESILNQYDASVEVDNFQYELLASEQQQWIDQTTERGVRQFQQATQEAVNLDLLQQWQTLDAEEKEQLQRQLTLRHFTQTATSGQSLDSLRYQYEQLSPEQQSQIDQIAHSLLFSTKESDQLALNESAFSLQTYPPNAQQTMAQLIAYRVGQIKDQYASEINMESFQWEALPSEAKNSVKRAVAYRQFKAHRSASLLLLEELPQTVSLRSIIQSNPEVFTIRGKLRSLVASHDTVAVSLGTINGDISTIVQPDGSFVFRKVAYQDSPQLFLEPATGSITQLLTTSLAELELIVEQDSQFVASFDNIYFETNQYSLTREALPTLERVIEFHRKHPDVTIQIHAYADSVGSNAFNYQLSQQRGKTIYQYLTGHQVNTQAIKLVPRGTEVLNSSKALSYSRRVEFVISGSNTQYNPTRQIYLLSATPKLEEIATRYQISIEELISQNPGISQSPAPYSIIKVMTNQRAHEE